MAQDFNKFPEALKIASAAGQDAGDRNAHQAGRVVWSADDLAAACEASDKVLVALGFGDFVSSAARRRTAA